MPIWCPECGQENQEGKTKCSACGESLLLPDPIVDMKVYPVEAEKAVFQNEKTVKAEKPATLADEKTHLIDRTKQKRAEFEQTEVLRAVKPVDIQTQKTEKPSETISRQKLYKHSLKNHSPQAKSKPLSTDALPSEAFPSEAFPSEPFTLEEEVIEAEEEIARFMNDPLSDLEENNEEEEIARYIHEFISEKEPQSSTAADYNPYPALTDTLLPKMRKPAPHKEEPLPTVPLISKSKPARIKDNIPQIKKPARVFSVVDPSEQEHLKQTSTVDQRILSGFIDGTILVVAIVFFALIRGLLSSSRTQSGFFTALLQSQNFAGLLFLPLFILYFTLMHGRWGQSIGNRVVKNRIIQKSGQPITFRSAFVRTVTFLLSGLATTFIPLGTLWLILGTPIQTFIHKWFFLIVLASTSINGSFIWHLFDLKKQGLHDKMTETFVVQSS